ncbi:unnamed protein product, partial [Mesorhabditis spiculigera]
MDDEECVAVAEPLADFLPIRLILLFQAGCGISVTLQSLYTIPKYASSHFHVNSKLLVILLLAMFIGMGCSIAGTFLYHVVMLSMPPGCHTLASPLQCFLMRGFSNFCMFAYTPMHFALSLERLAARHFGSKYEEMGCWLGILLAVMALTASAGIYYFIMSHENWGAENSVPYCTIGNKYTSSSASTCMLVLLGIDMVGLFLMGFAYWKEFKAVK